MINQKKKDNEIMDKTLINNDKNKIDYTFFEIKNKQRKTKCKKSIIESKFKY